VKEVKKEVQEQKEVKIEKEYTEEEMNIYQWAKDKKITTMNTIDESRFSEPLTRAELAKVMSVFAKEVL
jgi:hypothetical protein